MPGQKISKLLRLGTSAKFIKNSGCERSWSSPFRFLVTPSQNSAHVCFRERIRTKFRREENWLVTRKIPQKEVNWLIGATSYPPFCNTNCITQHGKTDMFEILHSKSGMISKS